MNPNELRILPFEIDVSIDNLTLSVTTSEMKLSEESNIKHIATDWYLIEAVTGQTIENSLGSKSLNRWELKSLKPSTGYKLRVIYHTDDKVLTEAIGEKFFNTPIVQIKQPDFDIVMNDNNTEVSIGLSSTYTIVNSNEEHIATTYVIRDTEGKVLYEKYRDTEHLTSFNITPYVTSNKGYFIEVSLHSENYDSPRKIKYIKTPVYVPGEPFDMDFAVYVDDTLIPSVRGVLNSVEEKTVQRVNLKIYRRGYPKEDILIFNRYVKQFEDKKTTELDNTFEIVLSEENMLDILRFQQEDKMGLWVHPWVFTLDVYFTDGSRASSKPIYKRVPLRGKPGRVEIIRTDIPTFKLVETELGSTWDKLEKVTWIVINAYGEKVLEETRFGTDQTFSLEPYVLKGELVKGLFYYVQAVITTSAGLSLVARTGNEKYGRIDRKGLPFVMENLKIKEPYIRVTDIETVDQNLFNVHLKFSKFEVNHNPYGRVLEHKYTTIRLYDVTQSLYNSNVKAKLVYESTLDPIRSLVLVRSKEIAPEFSLDATNLGIYYNREYRIDVCYVADNGLVSTIGSEIFKTPKIPTTLVSAPVVKESYIMPTGEIHLIVAELDESKVSIKNNSEDTIESTTFTLYKGKEVIYTKVATYDKFKFAIKDFDNGLIGRLEPGVEYWLEIQYKTKGNIVSPVTSVRYIVGNNTNKELDIVKTYVNGKRACFRFNNLPEDTVYSLSKDNLIINDKIVGNTLNLFNLYPNSEYSIKVLDKELIFTTDKDAYYSAEELKLMNAKWELEYDKFFRGNYLRTYITPSIAHYKVKDPLLTDLIRYKRVSIHLSESNSNPIFDMIFDTKLVNNASILEGINTLNFFTKERFYIKVQLGLSKRVWLEAKTLEFLVEEFDKEKFVEQFIWDQDDYEYLDKPILDSVDNKDDVMYPDSFRAKDRVLKLVVTMPKQFMEYVKRLDIYYNTKYGPYFVSSYQSADKPTKNYKGESLFFLLPYNDNILYSDFRDLTSVISTKPVNLVKMITFKDGSVLTF